MGYQLRVTAGAVTVVPARERRRTSLLREVDGELERGCGIERGKM
jgi:hypothetical protein